MDPATQTRVITINPVVTDAWWMLIAGGEVFGLLGLAEVASRSMRADTRHTHTINMKVLHSSTTTSRMNRRPCRLILHWPLDAVNSSSQPLRAMAPSRHVIEVMAMCPGAWLRCDVKAYAII